VSLDATAEAELEAVLVLLLEDDADCSSSASHRIGGLKKAVLESRGIEQSISMCTDNGMTHAYMPSAMLLLLCRVEASSCAWKRAFPAARSEAASMAEHVDDAHSRIHSIASSEPLRRSGVFD